MPLSTWDVLARTSLQTYWSRPWTKQAARCVPISCTTGLLNTEGAHHLRHTYGAHSPDSIYTSAGWKHPAIWMRPCLEKKMINTVHRQRNGAFTSVIGWWEHLWHQWYTITGAVPNRWQHRDWDLCNSHQGQWPVSSCQSCSCKQLQSKIGLNYSWPHFHKIKAIDLYSEPTFQMSLHFLSRLLLRVLCVFCLDRIMSSACKHGVMQMVKLFPEVCNLFWAISW